MIYDLMVLGGGPAGYLAAERAGNAGLSVLLIESDKVGGVCLNEGCIPTKTLLYSAKLFDGAVHGEKYGVTANGASICHAKVIERKNKVVNTLVAGVNAALKASHVTIVKAKGSITGRSQNGYTLSAGGEVFTGKRLLIATGSSPAVPPIPGLQEGLTRGFVLTNRGMLQQTKQPERLVIIGGGVIGLEFASYFSSIGTKVTVIEMLDHIAGENDPDMTAILRKAFEKKGVVFLLSAKVTAITENSVCYEREGSPAQIEADQVLLSIGRRANTGDIGLESINVLTERGAIVTDAHMKTNLPEVYAAGDVNGRSMLAHTAYREAEVAVNNMLGIKDEMRYDAVPSVLYTNPELGSVGETEATAKAKGMDVSVIKLPMQFSGRYVAENENGEGIMKLVVNNATQAVVGAQALCNYASEFILSCGMMVELRLTVNEVKKMVFPHPTACEIIREAIFQYR